MYFLNGELFVNLQLSDDNFRKAIQVLDEKDVFIDRGTLEILMGLALIPNGVLKDLADLLFKSANNLSIDFEDITVSVNDLPTNEFRVLDSTPLYHLEITRRTFNILNHFFADYGALFFKINEAQKIYGNWEDSFRDLQTKNWGKLGKVGVRNLRKAILQSGYRPLLEYIEKER